MRFRDHVHRPGDGPRGEGPAAAREHDLRHLRLGRITPRRQRSRPQRVPVDPGAMLRKMDVKPGRLDVADDLMRRNPLQVGDRRDDVPVAEGELAVHDRQRPPAFEMDDPAPHRVYRCAVRRRDVDPEVECPRTAGDARIVEVAAHRMRPVERLQRPRIQDTDPSRRGRAGCLTRRSNGVGAAALLPRDGPIPRARPGRWPSGSRPNAPSARRGRPR